MRADSLSAILMSEALLIQSRLDASPVPYAPNPRQPWRIDRSVGGLKNAFPSANQRTAKQPVPLVCKV